MTPGQTLQDCKKLTEAYRKLFWWQFKEKKKIKQQLNDAIAKNAEFINRAIELIREENL